LFQRPRKCPKPVIFEQAPSLNRIINKVYQSIRLNIPAADSRNQMNALCQIRLLHFV
jgi:hypothetical protein